MTPSNTVIVGPSPLKMLGRLGLAGVLVTGAVACGLLTLSDALFGRNWFLSRGWVIVVVMGGLFACLCGACVLVAIIWRLPRVEIGPHGFVVRYIAFFGSRSRSWSDIEGRFVVFTMGWGSKFVGYRLTQVYKESAGMKPNTLLADNDEAISGSYDIPISELAELLNQHKEDCPRVQ